MLHFLRPLPSARPVYVLFSSFLDSSFGLIGDLGFFSSTYLVHFSSIPLNYTVLQSLTPYLLDCEVSSSPYFLARWLVRRSQRMLAVWRRKHRNTSIPFTRLKLFKLLSVSLQLLSFIDPFLFALSFPSHLQPFQGAHLNFLECWRRLLRITWIARRSSLSILKEINPEYSLEGLMLKLKLQYFGHLMQTADSEKTLMLGKIEGRRRGRDGWTAWVWASSRRWWRTGKLGALPSMGSQRVGHDWVTEQQNIWLATLW